MKTCTVCQLPKPLDQFYLRHRRTSEDHRRADCIKCCIQRMTEYQRGARRLVPLTDEIRERVRLLWHAVGTQLELAVRLGYNKDFIYKVLHGKKRRVGVEFLECLDGLEERLQG